MSEEESDSVNSPTAVSRKRIRMISTDSKDMLSPFEVGTSSVISDIQEDRFPSLIVDDTIHVCDPTYSAVSPSDMSDIVQKLKAYLDQHAALQSRKFVTFNNYDFINLPNGINNDHVKSELRRYLKEALMTSNITISLATEIISKFLLDGRSIAMDPMFPKKPASAYHIFTRIMVDESDGKMDMTLMQGIGTRWRDGRYAKQRNQAEQRALDLQKEYINQIQTYVKMHPNLTREHQMYIEKALITTRKQIEKATGAELKPPTKPKKAKPETDHIDETPKTAFEFYKMTQKYKYQDLEPEIREKKLLKKFNKLDEVKRRIFESLETGSNSKS